MAAPSSSPPLRRVSRQEPCPICGATKHCELADDGAVHCMNTASDVRCNGRHGGWWHQLPPRWGGAEGSGRAAPAPEPPKADPVTMDAVYRALLAACRLGAWDRAYLTKDCGLPEDELGLYGTLPIAKYHQDKITALYNAGFSFETLRTVPGFVVKDGNLQLAGAGLLVAVVGPDGLIAGLQIRRTKVDPHNRYIWLSSTGTGGPSSGSPAHVVRAGEAVTVYLTEGPKKAHICALRTGCTTIGIAGHSSYTAATTALEALAALGAHRVIIALDADDPANCTLVEEVEKSRVTLSRAALAMGYAVRIARWDHADGKGIDDLLLGGHQPALEVFTATPNISVLPVVGPRRAAARYEMLGAVRAMQGPWIQPAHRTVLWAIWERVGYPGEQEAPLPQPVPLEELAEDLNIERHRLGRAVADLARAGLLVKRERRNATGGRTVLLAPTRVPHAEEQLPTSPHPKQPRKKRSRFHAAPCGGEVVTRKQEVCTKCGEVTDTATATPDRQFTHRKPTHVMDELRHQWAMEDAAAAAEEADEEATSSRAGARARRPEPKVGNRPIERREEIVRQDSAVTLDSGAAEGRFSTFGSVGGGAAAALETAILALTYGPDGRPCGPCPRCGYGGWSLVNSDTYWCSNCGYDTGLRPAGAGQADRGPP